MNSKVWPYSNIWRIVVNHSLIGSAVDHKPLTLFFTPQVLWRWLFPLSPSPHTLETPPCCAARSQGTRRLSFAGRRTGRTCHWPLTLTLGWRRCRLARCRSAVSSHRTRLRTVVWPTTPGAPGREQMQSSECSQVTEQCRNNVHLGSNLINSINLSLGLSALKPDWTQSTSLYLVQWHTYQLRCSLSLLCPQNLTWNFCHEIFNSMKYYQQKSGTLIFQHSL